MPAPSYLSITTPLGKDKLLLTRVQGSEGISRLYRFQLDLLADNKDDVPFDKLLGQGATIHLTMPQGQVRHFHGIVNRISQGERDDELTSYRAEIVPHFWLLTRRIQSRIFQHKNIPDILKEVLAGLDVKYEINGTFHPRNYCTQYSESDFHFASRLMEEEGIYYYFKHTDGGHQLVVANTPGSHVDVPEVAKVIYEGIRGGKRAEDRVFSWRKSQEIRSGKYTLWDHTFELPGQNLAAESLITDSVAVGKVTHKLKVANNDKLETYLFPGGYAHRFDGIDRSGSERPAELQKIFEDNTRTSKLRMEAEAAASLKIEGGSDCRQFTSGHKFTLERHFNADGPYVLTSVEHDAELVGDIHKKTEQALKYENSFTCIPAALPFRPPLDTPRPTMKGTQTATVVGPEGEEIHCDKYGRVKVQFHWDRLGKFDADSSCWVRVAYSTAGKGFGLVVVPRVGQEVVVDFEGGDPDEPVVIGTVFNSANMPPNPLPDDKATLTLRSSTYPGGGGCNEISLKDNAGEQKLNIQAEKDMTTLVKNDNIQQVDKNDTQKVGVDRVVEVGQNHQEKIGVDRSMSIGGSETKDIALNLLQNVGANVVHNVMATATENVGAVKTIVVGAALGFGKKGPKGMPLIDGKYNLEVNGDMNVTVTDKCTEIIGGDRVEDVQKDKSVTVSEDYKITLKKGNYGTTVEKGEMMIHVMSDAFGLQVPKDICSIVGMKLHIEAEKEMLLKCGDSTIKLTPDYIEIMSGKKATVALRKGAGLVESFGTKIVLESEEETEIVAEGDLDLQGQAFKLVSKSGGGKVNATQGSNLELKGTMVKINC